MASPNFNILYVKNPTESAAFYERVLGQPPVDASPTFVMFALESGVMLGLWAAHEVEPKATPTGGFELAFAVKGKGEVAQTYQAWLALGLPIIQAPTDMDFGHTFVAADLDGHRLRVFAPNA